MSWRSIGTEIERAKQEERARRDRAGLCRHDGSGHRFVEIT